MTSRPVNEYAPDRVSPPGDTLAETLEALGMTQAELATRLGRPRKTVNEIVKGKAAIEPETALQLESVLGVPAARARAEALLAEALAELDGIGERAEPLRELARHAVRRSE